MLDNIRAEVETILILITFQLAVPKLIRIYSLSFDKFAKYFNLGKDELVINKDQLPTPLLTPISELVNAKTESSSVLVALDTNDHIA